MTKLPKRPIDAQDMPWSYIGKDELDAAAALVWNTMRDEIFDPAMDGPGADPYHVQPSEQQETAQRAVLSILGTTVPALLRKRAKEIGRNGATIAERDELYDLADELEAEHNK